MDPVLLVEQFLNGCQLGILLFCGTLYWLGLNGSGSLGPLHWLTPLGGLALMAGWALLAAAGWRVTS